MILFKISVIFLVLTFCFIKFFVFCETQKNESSLELRELPADLRSAQRNLEISETGQKYRVDQEVLNSVYMAMKNNVQAKLGKQNFPNEQDRNQRDSADYPENSETFDLNTNEVNLKDQNQVIVRKSDNHAKGYRYGHKDRFYKDIYDDNRVEYRDKAHHHHHYEEEWVFKDALIFLRIFKRI